MLGVGRAVGGECCRSFFVDTRGYAERSGAVRGNGVGRKRKRDRARRGGGRERVGWNVGV